MSPLSKPSPEQRSQQIEPVLEAAGFTSLPADSAEKLSQIKSLPQLALAYYPDKEGKRHYWMADADYCHCLYVGDAAAYDRYRELRSQQKLAEEQSREYQQQIEQEQQMQMMSPFGGMGFGGGMWVIR
jgi:hypothetical protein